MTNARVAAITLLFALTSCSAAHPTGDGSGIVETTSVGPGPTAPADEGSAEYEVHEWGLVRQEATGDGVRIGGVAPPVDTRPLVVLKPILYFHTKERIDLASVSVSAPSGGSILEVWPLLHNGRTGDAIGGRVEWTRVAVEPTAGCNLSVLPTVDDPPCTALGGDFCEVASLAVARTNEAACVTTNGTTDRFLFYRGRSTKLRPPLVVARAGADGTISVTNTGSAKIPGKVVRIRTAEGETIASASAPPEPNATISIAVPATRLDLRSRVRELPPGAASIPETMAELGLTPQESEAFMRAWYLTLFPNSVEVQLDANLSTLKPIESILYFLPETSTDDVAKLDFSPAPRVVRRAIAVWTALP